MKKLAKTCKLIALTSLTVLMSNTLDINKVDAQSATFNNNPSATTNGDNNINEQLSNQNNAQNKTEINVPNIYPLNYPINTPVNTENDFGFNMSAAVNTLDSSNVTVFLGVVYHPGRTEDHTARMNKLRKETEYLEAQKQATAAQLQLLQKQVAEAELRLQKLQNNSNEKTPAQLPNENQNKLEKPLDSNNKQNLKIMMNKIKN